MWGGGAATGAASDLAGRDLRDRSGGCTQCFPPRPDRIEANIRYSGSLFQLRIRDDGKGIDTEVVAEGRAGHYGVPGMRERAKRIGGKLDVWTGTGAGTEIELSIPGSIAYGTSSGRGVLGLFRKKAANG